MPDWLAGSQATAIANLLAIVTALVVGARWLAPRLQTALAGVLAPYRRRRIAAAEQRLAYIGASLETPNSLVAQCLSEVLAILLALAGVVAIAFGWSAAAAHGPVVTIGGVEVVVFGTFAGALAGIAGWAVNTVLSLARNIQLLRDPEREVAAVRARLANLKAADA